jgi:glycosyltransferase 2 family protein
VSRHPWRPVNPWTGSPVRLCEQASPHPDVGRGGHAVREADIQAARWRWARPLGGALVLAALVVWLGTGPFLEALRATDLRALSGGAAIALVTTVCAAWRWRLVAHRLGIEVPLGGAVAACYRAQFLNVTLPGGVLGDVGRGVRHGRDTGDVGRGLRSVAWERSAGQLVLVTLTAVVVLVARPLDLALPDAWSPLVGGAVVVVVVVVGVALLAGSRQAGTGLARAGRVAMTDLRALASAPASVGVVLASVVVLAGHLATFVLAARTVGVRTPTTTLLPLALVVLVVSAVPLNLAGWGPREGAAAWAFGAGGLGAAEGLSTAVAFGMIAFVATLPGAVLLLTGRVQRTVEPAPSRAAVGPGATSVLAAHPVDAVGGAVRG